MSKNKKTTTSDTEKTIIEPLFSIRGIELLHFTLSLYQGEEPKEFRFDAQVSQEINLKDKTVVSKINLSIKDALGVGLGNVILACIFEVSNLNEVIVHKKSASELGFKLNQVTVSTARGVMFGLFRGTILHNAILPIVDAAALKNNS